MTRFRFQFTCYDGYNDFVSRFKIKVPLGSNDFKKGVNV